MTFFLVVPTHQQSGSKCMRSASLGPAQRYHRYHHYRSAQPNDIWLSTQGCRGAMRIGGW